jgi:hypothetical protein
MRGKANRGAAIGERVMSTPLSDRSNEDIAREILKPLTDLLAKQDEELKRMDEQIREAERKAKAALHPEL